MKGLTGERDPVQDFTYDQLPARIVFGPGTARTALADEITRLDAERVMVIASTRDAERVATLTAPLGARVAGTFTAVREHVPLPTAEAARAAAADVRADALLAIGGGSTIGAAKAVALTARIPIVSVPTTYSGSEVTAVWGLTENGRKTTGTDPAVLPRVVVYDPELLATLHLGRQPAPGRCRRAAAVGPRRGAGRSGTRRNRVPDGMSFEDKITNKAQELRGRMKRNAGQVTGDRRLEAEGRAEERSGSLRQAGAKLKDAILGPGRRPRY